MEMLLLYYCNNSSNQVGEKGCKALSGIWKLENLSSLELLL